MACKALPEPPSKRCDLAAPNQAEQALADWAAATRGAARAPVAERPPAASWLEGPYEGCVRAIDAFALGRADAAQTQLALNYLQARNAAAQIDVSPRHTAGS